MARQIGMGMIEGTLHNLTFYRMRGKYYVRAKRKVSRKRILTDPKFARVMENAGEFKVAVRMGKLLRDSIKNRFPEAGSRATSIRVLQQMLKIKKLDVTSKRGKRNAGTALASDEAKKLLKGFEFNPDSHIASILFKPVGVDMVTGVISIADLIPLKDVKPPAGATHLTLSGAYADVNFASNTSAVAYTNEVNLAIDGNSSTVTLTPSSLPEGTGTKFCFLQVRFFQEVGGVQYVLKEGKYQAVRIVEVG